MTDLQRPQTSTGSVPPPSTGSPPDDDTSSTAQAAKEEAGQVASTAVEQGRQAAGTAVEAGGQVTSTAADGARQVASEAAQQVTEVTKAASTQARELAQQAQSRLREQAASQTERAASGLRDLGQHVRALSEGQNDKAGVAADCARQVADKINEVASRVEERGFDGTVQDVRDFARRRPAVFLASAVAAGFVVGRLGRGLQAANHQGNQQGTPGQPASFQPGRQQIGSQDTVPLARALSTVGEGRPTAGSSGTGGDGDGSGGTGAV